MTKEIYTRKGQVILVDEEDYDLVNQFTWSLNHNGYPSARVYPGKQTVSLHTFLRPPSPGCVTDHVNRIRTDARQKNLEIVTQAKNLRRGLKNPSAGVAWDKRRQCFHAKLTVNDKTQNLGRFKTFDLALLARIIGEIRFWGEPTQARP